MKIVRLVSSFRGDDSLSMQLGNAIINKLKEHNPNAEIITRDLTKKEIPHLNKLHFKAFITPTENLTPELKAALSYSDEAVEELNSADVLVIDVPMYNFGIPSSLKAWIDHIVRSGITFQYIENGVEGLVKNTKVYLAIATGGVYSEGLMKEYDFTEGYLKTILGFIGITDVTVFRVEGSAISDLKDFSLTKAIQTVSNYNF